MNILMYLLTYTCAPIAPLPTTLLLTADSAYLTCIAWKEKKSSSKKNIINLTKLQNLHDIHYTIENSFTDSACILYPQTYKWILLKFPYITTIPCSCNTISSYCIHYHTLSAIVSSTTTTTTTTTNNNNVEMFAREHIEGGNPILPVSLTRSTPLKITTLSKNQHLPRCSRTALTVSSISSYNPNVTIAICDTCSSFTFLTISTDETILNTGLCVPRLCFFCGGYLIL